MIQSDQPHPEPVSQSDQPRGRRRLDRVARALLWALTLGMMSTVAFAVCAPKLAPAIVAASRSGSTELVSSGIALGLLLLLQALLVFVIVGLAQLIGDFSPASGVGAGIVASLLPVAIAIAAGSFAVLLPVSLLALRIGGAALAALAGALGSVTGRRLIRSRSKR